MNKILLKLSFISVILLLLTIYSFADDKKKEVTKTEKSDEKRPVDDAGENKPKEDYPKGGDKIKDKEVNTTIKLSSIKKQFTIKRSGLHYPPYKCFIYHHSSGKETDIGTSNKVSFTFKINKSLLSIGDEILITNRLDSTGPLTKEIIHDVEIIK